MLRGKAEKPKTFSLHWGMIVIAEETQIVTKYHRPPIQLLEFTAGVVKGARDIRFCSYNYRGRCQRSPLIIDGADILALRAALKTTPDFKQRLATLSSE